MVKLTQHNTTRKMITIYQDIILVNVIQHNTENDTIYPNIIFMDTTQHKRYTIYPNVTFINTAQHERK